MLKKTMPREFLAPIPHAIELDWDDVYAPRLAGFPVNLCYAGWIQGSGVACATYVFDPTTFVEGEQSRQMQYRPTVDSDFSVLVVLRPEGRMETFKCRGSEMICEACGPDFRTAMIQTTACGLAVDEPWDNRSQVRETGD